MRPMSLLDNQSDQPEDQIMTTDTESHDTALSDLTVTVKVMESNYATKEALAVTNGKLDVTNDKLDHLASSLQAFQALAFQTFATKAELANAIHQLTWRMAGFTVVLISTMVATARYL